MHRVFFCPGVQLNRCNVAKVYTVQVSRFIGVLMFRRSGVQLGVQKYMSSGVRCTGVPICTFVYMYKSLHV